MHPMQTFMESKFGRRGPRAHAEIGSRKRHAKSPSPRLGTTRMNGSRLLAKTALATDPGRFSKTRVKKKPKLNARSRF